MMMIVHLHIMFIHCFPELIHCHLLTLQSSQVKILKVALSGTQVLYFMVYRVVIKCINTINISDISSKVILGLLLCTIG